MMTSLSGSFSLDVRMLIDSCQDGVIHQFLAFLSLRHPFIVSYRFRLSSHVYASFMNSQPSWRRTRQSAPGDKGFNPP